MSKTITLHFHAEATVDGGIIWWIDTPDVRGFYAAGDSVADVRSNAITALHEVGYADADFAEQITDGTVYWNETPAVAATEEPHP